MEYFYLYDLLSVGCYTVEEYLMRNGHEPIWIKGNNLIDVKELAVNQAEQYLKVTDTEFKEITNIEWDRGTLTVYYTDNKGLEGIHLFKLKMNEGLLEN